MRRLLRPCSLTLSLLLAGCHGSPPPNAEPDLEIAVPAGWQGGDSEAGQIADAWWRGFQDPVLDELVTSALNNNRDLRAAAARLDAASAQAIIAGAPVTPAVDLGLNGSRTRRNFIGFPIPGSGSSVLSTTSETYGVSLDLSWELDLWGRVRSAEAAALAEVQASAADLAAAQLSIVAQTAKAYFAVVESRQQIALSEATLASFQDTAEDVRDRYRRGVRSALDAHLAEAAVSDAEAVLARRREQYARGLRQLEILVGRYPAGAASPSEDFPAALPGVPAGLPAELLRRRPDLAAAERRLAAAGARVEAARAAMYPRLSLTAGGGTTSTGVEDLIDPDFRVWSLAGNLLMPLLRGGALRAEAARNEALEAEILATYAGAVLRAFSEVEIALATEADLMQRENSLRRSVEHATAAADLARSRYRTGLEPFLAIAESRRSAFLAESALLAARRQRFENRIDLFLALGGGFAAGGEGSTPDPSSESPADQGRDRSAGSQP